MLTKYFLSRTYSSTRKSSKVATISSGTNVWSVKLSPESHTYEMGLEHLVTEEKVPLTEDVAGPSGEMPASTSENITGSKSKYM